MPLFILIAALAVTAPSADAAVLREAAGLVQVRPAGSERWSPAGKTPRTLGAGDAVRTGFNARAVVELDGGAVVESAGNAQFTLDAAPRGGAVVGLLFGSVSASAGRGALELRAPTATVRARSADAVWRTTVGGGGGVVVAGLRGLTGVESGKGETLLLRAGERVDADLAGLHEAVAAPTPERARREGFAARMRRELGYELAGDQVQRLASGELRRAEHELGRVQVDASGALLRVEEYVVRPAPNVMSIVTMNSRRGAGLSWYAWTGTFNAPLPLDLAPVYAILPGSVGAPAPWTLTGMTVTVSNGKDALTETAAGGHQVDVNSNADPLDDVAALFDPAKDAFVGTAGLPVFKVIFDRDGLYSDGVLKRGWTGTNLQALSDRIPATTNDPLTGALLGAALPADTQNAVLPPAGAARLTLNDFFSDGTAVVRDFTPAAPAGQTVPQGALGSALSGPALQARFLGRGLDVSILAGEFGAGPVDVLVSPRTLIETGGLP